MNIGSKILSKLYLLIIQPPFFLPATLGSTLLALLSKRVKEGNTVEECSKHNKPVFDYLFVGGKETNEAV